MGYKVVKEEDFKLTSKERNSKNGKAAAFASYKGELTNYGLDFSVNKRSLYNCQMCTIGNFQLLMNSDDLSRQMSEIKILTNQQLALIDIDINTYNSLKDREIKKIIKNKMKYVNSNGSTMYIIILDLNKL